ncbi:MAG: hypothetical protein WDO74_10935 [Pseudomonadota bacterium]
MIAAELKGRVAQGDEYIAKLLAARPVDDTGLPLCDLCKNQVLGAREFVCSACTSRMAAEERARDLAQCIKARLESARSTLPDWDFADTAHPLFSSRVKHQSLRAAAKKWALDKGSLMLSGPAGIGKTVCSATIARRLVRDGETAALAAGAKSTIRPHELLLRVPQFKIASAVRWVSALDLVAARRGHPLGRGECALWDTATKAGVLFLDEVGQEQAQAGWLLELLDARYRRCAPTVTSSGLTKAELETRYGSGAARRLVEPGGVWIDAFGGPGGG